MDKATHLLLDGNNEFFRVCHAAWLAEILRTSLLALSINFDCATNKDIYETKMSTVQDTTNFIFI